jgi:hypothetical protein
MLRPTLLAVLMSAAVPTMVLAQGCHLIWPAWRRGLT